MRITPYKLGMPETIDMQSLNIYAPTSGSAPPPVPDLTDIAALYSSFGIAAGWQNAGGLIYDGDSTEILSTASAPYPLDWATIINPTLLQWQDQSGGDFNAPAGAVSPDTNVGTQRFTYDGTQSLVTPLGIISGDKLTIYCVFSTNNLAAAQTLLQSEYTTDYTTETQNLFAIYLTGAGVLTASQSVNDLPSFNSKVKTLGDTNLHLLTAVFDRTIAGAGATVAKLDNSTTGWSNGATDNMAGSFTDAAIGIGLGKPTGAIDRFLDGTENETWIFLGAHDDARQTSVYDFLKTTAGYPIP